jgi:hypothetical protein
MAFNARVFRIFIASPSDVQEERDIIARIIREWNDLHSFERKVVLLPLRWETHSAPELNRRPQEIINTEIVDMADMAVGVFWTRIGTPTGGFESGTIEEIERLGNAGKLVMCYFSKAKVELDKVDLEQYKNLKEFKKKTYPNGLIENYSNGVEFRDLFAKQLEIKIRTLIAKDNEKDGEATIVPNRPFIDFGFIDPVTKESCGDELSITPRILNFNSKEINALPDFILDEKKKDLFYSVNKNYYRDYAEYIKEDWFLVPIQLVLNNPSSIAIRDIFIEITCEKTTDFNIIRKKAKKPESSRGSLSIDFGHEFEGLIGKSSLVINEKEDNYNIHLSYEALQPKRSVTISHPFFIGGQKKQLVEFNVNIYADCFPKPIEKKLKINILPKKINRPAIEVLTEMEILKQE